MPRHGREAQDYQDAAGQLFVLPDKREDAVFIVGAIDPKETLHIVVRFPKSRLGTINLIQVFDETLQAAMIGALLQKSPIEFPIGIPLGALANFAAHKEHLFAGKKPLVTEQGAQVREF